MLIRDIQSLSSKVYDVLVVGGGIHGATIAYHCAKAGYSTVLIEKDDFGSGTSANSLKIIHGGLRYLQHLNIKRMRHSIGARREMMAMAPDLVAPLPCMMPLYGKGLRGKAVMRSALFVNDCIGFDRNFGLPPDIHLPGGTIVSKEACLEAIPGIGAEGLHGASVWYDGLGVNTERMILEYIQGTVHYGGGVANYTKVTGLEKDGNALYSVDIEDTLSAQTSQLKTRYLVNAAGPWFENCCALSHKKDREEQQWAMALNIVSKKKIFEKYAVALEGTTSYEDKDAVVKRGKRLYFFVPWREHTMIGTEYEPCTDSPDTFRVKKESIQRMVDEVNGIYPPAKLKYEDISFYHAGLVPMKNDRGGGDVQLEKNSLCLSHGTDGYERVLSVKGVKYTTAPHIAGQVVKMIGKKHPPVARKASPPYSSCGQENRQDFEDGNMDRQAFRQEVRQMVEKEMACKLSDIVFRRTGLGSAERPAMGILHIISDCMADMLGWNDRQKEEELQDVMKRYEPLAD